jgi:hypothetical protein
MAQTIQTIQQFYTQAQRKDFARTNLFRVLSINFGENSPTVLNETELVYARTASVPGKSIVNIETPYMGLKFNVPGVVQYEGSAEYKINFYGDEAQALRQKFLQVSENTFSDASSTGNYFIPTRNATIDLLQLNKQLDPVSKIQLVGVSIRNVGTLEYDITSTGEVQNFDVTIAYHFWRKTG